MDFDSYPQSAIGTINLAMADDRSEHESGQSVLRADWLTPHPSRLPADSPNASEILAAHAQGVGAGVAGYVDPVTGLFAFTAVFLRDRGWCCDRGCRHCPYVGA